MLEPTRAKIDDKQCHYGRPTSANPFEELRTPNNIVSGVIRYTESSRGARLSSSFADIDKFVERGPTMMSLPGRMPVEDRNFPAAQFRPAFEQVNYKCSQHMPIELKMRPNSDSSPSNVDSSVDLRYGYGDVQQ
ncbi:hypothetical protein THAOC_08117 [Thalassiosira oceanica]|uniref:Uncharacterized protein n=1 Tax=Thalassiosira oceanica TaxID=159749 RepID=K0SYN3_THAOC|nr:hypothetical protein THAOC_08117 [Thalassiosira oceanica]|eukprot:EJK70515.1 hypothetical protein THAOC_08117 [Thalassiosira oceanica]